MTIVLILFIMLQKIAAFVASLWPLGLTQIELSITISGRWLPKITQRLPDDVAMHISRSSRISGVCPA